MADATPIAQLASEYLTVVVPKNSPYRTADELAEAWREKKGGLPVAGGSMGGVDQIFAAQVAQSMKCRRTASTTCRTRAAARC